MAREIEESLNTSPTSDCECVECDGERNWVMETMKAAGIIETVKPSCELCRFFWGTGTGVCRRHSPVVKVGWPITNQVDWCGDWEKKGIG